MILTCPSCTARFVLPRSEDELRDVEVTHPACGHAFAPFAERPAVVVETAAVEPVAVERDEAVVEKAPEEFIALEAPSFEDAALADDDLYDDDVCETEEDDGEAPAEIDTHSLRRALTQATTTPFRNLVPKLAAAGFACAAAAELVFLLDKGIDGALPAAHFTLALLGMGGEQKRDRPKRDIAPRLTPPNAAYPLPRRRR